MARRRSGATPRRVPPAGRTSSQLKPGPVVDGGVAAALDPGRLSCEPTRVPDLRVGALEVPAARGERQPLLDACISCQRDHAGRGSSGRPGRSQRPSPAGSSRPPGTGSRRCSAPPAVGDADVGPVGLLPMRYESVCSMRTPTAPASTVGDDAGRDRRRSRSRSSADWLDRRPAGGHRPDRRDRRPGRTGSRRPTGRCRMHRSPRRRTRSERRPDARTWQFRSGVMMIRVRGPSEVISPSMATTTAGASSPSAISTRARAGCSLRTRARRRGESPLTGAKYGPQASLPLLAWQRGHQ